MLKAVKECLKNWLVTHERLYWYIVVGLAVLGFGIVTALGCAKLEKAEAASEICINAEQINYDILPTYQQVVDLVVQYYGVSASEVSADNTVMFSTDGVGYYIFYGGAIDKLECYGLTSGASINAKSSVYKISYNAETGSVRYSSFSGGFMSFDFERNAYSGYVWGKPIYCWARNGVTPYINAVTEYPVTASYSSDAPYLSFEKLEIDNRLCKDEEFIGFVGTNAELYSVFFQPSTWTYTGKINNVSLNDTSYTLNLKFEVEIPTSDYVSGLYDYFGYNSEKDKSVLKYNKSLINYWYKDDDADFRTITIDYNVDVFPGTDGNISYSFTFAEWEYLFRAFSEELQAEILTYDSRWRAVVLSYMHVKKITTEVITTRSDSIVYGGYTTNVFERGVYGSCADVYTVVDKNFVTGDVLDDMISDDLQKLEDERNKQLEDKIKDLEQQLEDVTNSQTGFAGSLETTNLWTSFTNMVQGLAGFAPAIASLSSLIGIVLAFLPLQVGTVIASTFLAICVVALIKAIKG